MSEGPHRDFPRSAFLKTSERTRRFRRPYPDELGAMIRRLELAEFESGAGDHLLPLIRGFIPFGRLSELERGCRERILAGAFTKSLNGGFEVVCTVDHDHQRILGRSSDGTLRLSEDQRGLHFAARPRDVEYARRAIALLQSGRIRGASFTYRPDGRGAFRAASENGQRVTELVNVDLTEVAIVEQPFYTDSHAWMASAR